MVYSPTSNGIFPSRDFPNQFEKSNLTPQNIKNGITIGAIAKNESRYILEWIAYHLAIGIDRIIVYSNDTEDNQCEKLELISQHDCRVSWHPWKSIPGISPQISAYQDISSRVSTPWMTFTDIDEFIVPLNDDSIHEWLARIPEDVSSVHINWRGFGSAGHTTDDYELVTRTFDKAAARGWGNHHHFKSVARTSLVSDIHIHNITTLHGRRTLSDFDDFTTIGTGQSDRIAHHGIQINHYQCKTFAEFKARMHRGDPNFPTDHPDRNRDDSLNRFLQLDLNEEADFSIRRFDFQVDSELSRIYNIIKK